MKSAAPYSQSRPIQSVRDTKEPHDEFEQRVWRERIHGTDDGFVQIPPMAFKNALSECAKFLSMSVKGKGKATYTKHFEAGVLCLQPLVLPIKVKQVAFERLFVPADGVRGGGKRVWKYFPLIHSWSGKVEFTILDQTIGKDIFETHIEETGAFIGIGRFRPRNNGIYGRWTVEKVTWS
jgi:hypothetical protein